MCLAAARGRRAVLRLTDAVAWESHPRAAPRGGGGADGSSDGAGMMGRGQIWRVCLWGGGVGSHCVADGGFCVCLCERAINHTAQSQV